MFKTLYRSLNTDVISFVSRVDICPGPTLTPDPLWTYRGFTVYFLRPKL